MIECDLASLLDTGCSHLFVGPYFTTETILLWSLMQRVVQNTRVGLYRVLGVLCLQLFYLLRKRQSHDLTLKADSCGLNPNTHSIILSGLSPCPQHNSQGLNDADPQLRNSLSITHEQQCFVLCVLFVPGAVLF